MMPSVSPVLKAIVAEDGFSGKRTHLLVLEGTPRFVIGRDRGCTLRYDDPQVAEHQLEIDYDERTRFWVATPLRGETRLTDIQVAGLIHLSQPGTYTFQFGEQSSLSVTMG